MTDPAAFDDLAVRLDAVEQLLAELEHAIPPVAVATELETVTAAAMPPRTRFDDPIEWVDRVLAGVWSSRWPWCPRWWAHRDAYERICWLWRSWEAAIAAQDRDPATMANWLLTADAHRQVLQAESGPFANCRSGSHGLASPMLPITDRTADPADGTTDPAAAAAQFHNAHTPPPPEGDPDEQ